MNWTAAKPSTAVQAVMDHEITVRPLEDFLDFLKEHVPERQGNQANSEKQPVTPGERSS